MYFFPLPVALALNTACSGGAAVTQSVAPPQQNTAPSASADSTLGSTSEPSPLGPTGRWKILLDDEFSGSSIDTSRWHTSYWWGGTKSPELQEYVPQGVTMTDGILHLTAAPRPSNEKFPYTSGMISSWGKLNLTPGTVVEARVRAPHGVGLWPAIWLHASNGGWPPEIDILEVRGGDPDIWRLSAHWAEKGEHKSLGFRPQKSDYATGYHTVTMQWDASKIVWFIDGVQQGLITDPKEIPTEPMYLIVNFAIGSGGWTGKPDATTPFPASFDVDYVRVWTPAP